MASGYTDGHTTYIDGDRQNTGAHIPENSDELDELTIYTVPLRYDDLLDAEPLDREYTVKLVDQTEAWAGRQIH